MQLLKYIKEYWWQSIAGIFFKILEAIFELCVPLVVASIVDRGIAHHDLNFIYSRGLLLLGLAIFGYLSALVCQWYASNVSQSIGTTLRHDMYESINKMDDQQINDYSSSSLSTRLINDVVQLQLAIAMTIRLTSRAPFIMIGSLVMTFFISGKLSLILLVGVVILGIGMSIITITSMPYFNRIQVLLDQLALKVRENLNGIRVIKAFSNSKKEIIKQRAITKKQKDEQVKVGRIQALLNPFTFLMVNVCIIIIIYAGGIEVNIGGLTQGEIIALINYMNSILQALIVYSNVLSIYNKSGASYHRVMEVINTKSTIEDKGTLSSIENTSPIIQFENVCLAYDKKDILSDISLTINAGETIGIIGGTGSGKTSIVNLLMRYYDATNGNILIANKPIKDYSLKGLRKDIGLVRQNASLFTGSIKENLQMGSNCDISKALEISQAKEFVDKIGVDSKIVEGGKNLSGGQRQRLTIARALVKDPKILILDDSASALDFATESKLRHQLNELKETTKIIISQRVSSIKEADKILVLYHGKIVGFDNHTSLLNDCTIYQEIYQSQTKGGNRYE